MREAFDRVKVPLLGVFAIVLITLFAFALVRPEALQPREQQWTLTGNVVADDALFDGKVDALGPCDSLEDPVCGTDGVTYVNFCQARAAGVDMHHRGSCTGEWIIE